MTPMNLEIKTAQGGKKACLSMRLGPKRLTQIDLLSIMRFLETSHPPAHPPKFQGLRLVPRG